MSVSQDSDAFQDRYQLVDLSEGNRVTLNAVCKCYKDEFTKWNHRNVLKKPTHSFCRRCKKRQPQTLQKLCCIEILKDESLARTPFESLPPVIIYNLMEVAAKYILDPNLESTFAPIKVLLSHWPFKDFNLGNMSKKATVNGVLIEMVFAHFLADFHGRALQMPTSTYLKELVMKDVGSSDWDKLHTQLALIADENKMVPESIAPEWSVTYIITTAIFLPSKLKLHRLLTTLRKLRSVGCMLEIRAVRVHLEGVDISDVAALFSLIHSEELTSFHIQRQNLNHDDIVELTNILYPCTELTSLSLQQSNRYTSVVRRDAEPLANAMQALLSQKPNLTHLTLEGFPVCGLASRYPLPPKLTSLKILYCYMKNVDWEYWSNNVNISKLKELEINRCKHTGGFEGLLRFVEKQNETLSYVYLRMSHHGEQLTVAHLRQMITHFERFQKLKCFVCCTDRNSTLVQLLTEVFSCLRIIESLEVFYLWSASSDTAQDLRDLVEGALKTICAASHQPLHSATVSYVRSA